MPLPAGTSSNSVTSHGERQLFKEMKHGKSGGEGGMFQLFFATFITFLVLWRWAMAGLSHMKVFYYWLPGLCL